MTKSNTACIYKASSIVPIENNPMLCYQNHYIKTILLYQYIIHSLLISCWLPLIFNLTRRVKIHFLAENTFMDGAHSWVT